jgi:hypothetical protein
MISALQRHRSVIRQVVERKYRTRQFNSEDKIIIGLEDLP